MLLSLTKPVSQEHRGTADLFPIPYRVLYGTVGAAFMDASCYFRGVSPKALEAPFHRCLSGSDAQDCNQRTTSGGRAGNRSRSLHASSLPTMIAALST